MKTLLDAAEATIASSEAARASLESRWREERGAREAADMIGIAEGALKVRLHRARAALKTLVEPHWEGTGSS